MKHKQQTAYFVVICFYLTRKVIRTFSIGSVFTCSILLQDNIKEFWKILTILNPKMIHSIGHWILSKDDWICQSVNIDGKNTRWHIVQGFIPFENQHPKWVAQQNDSVAQPQWKKTQGKNIWLPCWATSFNFWLSNKSKWLPLATDSDYVKLSSTSSNCCKYVYESKSRRLLTQYVSLHNRYPD